MFPAPQKTFLLLASLHFFFTFFGSSAFSEEKVLEIDSIEIKNEIYFGDFNDRHLTFRALFCNGGEGDEDCQGSSLMGAMVPVELVAI